MILGILEHLRAKHHDNGADVTVGHAKDHHENDVGSVREKVDGGVDAVVRAGIAKEEERDECQPCQ